MDLHSQISYKGNSINIYYDEDPMNPRKDYDNLGTIYTAHRRCQPEEDFQRHFDMPNVFEGKIGIFRESFCQEYIALPIYLYEHSGITISTEPFSCPWDSGFFGIIAVSLEKVREEYEWKAITDKRRKKIKEYLQEEIETLNDYYTGQVFRYEVIEECTGREIDSSSGFFGVAGVKAIETDCKAMIDELETVNKRERYRYLMDRFKKGIQLCIPFSAFPQIVPQP